MDHDKEVINLSVASAVAKGFVRVGDDDVLGMSPGTGRCLKVQHELVEAAKSRRPCLEGNTLQEGLSRGVYTTQSTIPGELHISVGFVSLISCCMFPGAGKGLFAAKEFATNSKIIGYHGEVRAVKETEMDRIGLESNRVVGTGLEVVDGNGISYGRLVIIGACERCAVCDVYA